MNKALRKIVADRLRERLAALFPLAIEVRPQPASDLLVFRLPSRGPIFVFAGIGIASKLDRFWSLVAWSSGTYPVCEMPGRPFATLAEMQAGADVTRPVAREGVVRLDMLAGRRPRDYDVSLSSLQRTDSEYITWFNRTSAQPSWQAIMTPRAHRYADEVASDIANVAAPFSDELLKRCASES